MTGEGGKEHMTYNFFIIHMKYEIQSDV